MSLKAFHIFFILVSILLAFGVGAWGLVTYVARSDATYLALGILSVVVAIALIIYGVKFFRKLGHA